MSWLLFRYSQTGASHLMGPPSSSSPPPDPASSEAKLPTSLWKGEGQLPRVLASEGAEVVLKEPTSLNGGEGLVAKSMGEVRGTEGESEGEGGGGEVVVEEENERTSTSDGVDVCLKLRSPQ